jgi:parallel beta-helix repeat protein
MSRKLVLTTIFVTVFIGTLGLSLRVQRVEASGTIYVKADGSIDPPDAPISTADNVTYTLTDNIYDSIVIERDNIIVDGAGYTVQGKGSGIGIDLTERSNVTIKNTEIKAFFHGIYLWNSSNNSISRNNITANNMSGIRLFRFSYHNIISGNDITSNINGIGLVDSSGNRVYGNSIIKNHLNIELYRSSANFIYHNHFVSNATQVYTYRSDNVWDDGYPSGGSYWSDYDGTDYNQGLNQDINGSDGIGDKEYSIDGNNTDHYPLVGIFSDFNATSEHHVQTICNSTISDFKFDGTAIHFHVSGEDGTTGFCRTGIPTALMHEKVVIEFLYWDPSKDPHWCPDCETWIIAYNNFLSKNETMQRIQGNYTGQVLVNWTDYYSPCGQSQKDLYNVSESNSLIIKSGSGNSTTIQGELVETYIRNMIDLYLSESLDTNAYRVFINGTEVTHTPLPCSNSTHSYLYFTYHHSTQEIIIIPESPSLIILSLFMIATLLTVIVYRRKHT